MVKVIVGMFMVLVGIALGLYVGVYVMLIGGVMDIAGQINILVHDGTAFNAVPLALGILKVLFAGLVGWISGIMLILPGLAVAANDR